MPDQARQSACNWAVGRRQARIWQKAACMCSCMEVEAAQESADWLVEPTLQIGAHLNIIHMTSSLFDHPHNAARYFRWCRSVPLSSYRLGPLQTLPKQVA